MIRGDRSIIRRWAARDCLLWFWVCFRVFRVSEGVCVRVFWVFV